jgi:hypothetical protein
MENLQENLKKRIHEILSEKNKIIRKTFRVNLADLQDDPESVVIDIYQYLKAHQDKIEDFWIEHYVDPESFTPVLEVKILPVEDIRKHMLNSFWESLSSVNLQVVGLKLSMEDTVNTILSQEVGMEIKKSLLRVFKETITALVNLDSDDFQFSIDQDHNGNTAVNMEVQGENMSIQSFLKTHLNK